jgi:hypothetical protein
MHFLQQIPAAFRVTLVRTHQPFEGRGVTVGHLLIKILMCGRLCRVAAPAHASDASDARPSGAWVSI